MSEEPKEGKKTARPFLERDENSEIDEEAGLIFKTAMPRGWVDNTLQKDYAKDHHIEKAEPIAWEGRVTKQVTGKTIYVQRKGTKKADLRYGGKVVAYDELELRHLTHWADESPLPVFLVVVDITAKKVYWLFMQRYLADENAWRGQATFTVHIPIENELSDIPRFE